MTTGTEPVGGEQCSPRRRQVDDRQALLGIIHRGSAQLGLDDDDRRAMQARLTGRESCRDMDLTQLRTVAWHLKRSGADIGIPGLPPPAKRLDRVTGPQLARLERLAVAMGWPGGLADDRLLGFVRRTAKLDHIRFLSRRQASDCITGLERWLKQQEQAKRGESDA